MLPARRCSECGKVSVSAATCRFYGAEGGQTLALSGQGRLVSWTVIRIAPARYAAEAPYAVGLLELDEGPRITARVSGDPEHLAEGQRMAVVTVDAARGPIFQPA